LLCSTAALRGQTGVSLGGGAPNAVIAEAFEQAYFQNGFNLIAAAVPDANVSKYGSTGYYQQFGLASSSSTKLALILPNPALAGTDGAVLQVLDGMYSYYSGLGVNTVGYPTISTQPCPSNPNCQYQLFSNNYALFYYISGTVTGGFQTTGAIYTAWTNLGGISSGLGPASAAQAAVTSEAKTTGNQQLFTNAVAVAVTSGVNSGSTFAVVEPIYDIYNSVGGPAGQIGFPTSTDMTLPDGSHKQTFEFGRVTYVPGSSPVLVLPVNEIDISPIAPVTLQYGQTITASVNLFDLNGVAAVGRSVSWSTSNSAAVALVSSSGYSAVFKAVGNGVALLTASSEGIVSKTLAVTAIEPCCQIGQGAPTTTIQSAFQAAVTRNKIAVQVPAPNPVRVAGSGYLQDLYSPDGTIHYLVAEANSSQIAYIVAGSTLAAYTAAGGPTGSLAYPTSDLSAGGTQLFQGGALAGSPVQTVTGGILTKWAVGKYEAGPLGAPVAAQSPFASISGYTGFAQSFAGGAIFAIANGVLGGQAYQSTGLILSRYLALSGPAGEMGIPTGDPSTTAGVVSQNFENGYINLQPGAAAAVEHLNPRVPTVTATPSTVLPGGKLHLAITGFNNNASLTVSQTGQTNFVVSVPAGSYSWDTYIPAAAAAGTVTVTAAASATSTATATYTIRSIAAAGAKLTKTQGDNQTAPPGTALASPLAVTLTDATGAVISGATVTFSPSPGASVSPTSAVTDSNGRASASLRLPAAPGIAAVTVQALGQIAIFDAAASGSFSLPNYPHFVAATPTGAQVAAAASMIAYYQNLKSMPAANGQATPPVLDAYLTTLSDGYLNSSQLVNFWRLVNFTGANVNVSIENTDLGTIRTLTAGGDPVLLNLALTQNGIASEGTTVVATGIGSDGSVTILDPNPSFAQSNLNNYLNGFSANGATFQGTVLSALRLLPVAPSATGFLVNTVSQPYSALPALNVQSAAGTCSMPLIIQDAYAGGSAPPTVLASRFVYCDGTQTVYQASIGLTGSYTASVIDLSVAPGSGTVPISGTSVSAYQISRASGKLAVTAPSVAFTTASVLNAASFQPGLSPGGIFSIFGTGLASSSGSPATSILIGGLPTTILLATPFQINAQVPAAAAAGNTTLQVNSPYGSAVQTVSIQPTAPGIFIVGTASDGVSLLGAIVNQNGVLNGPASPATRGSTITIYGTGLGATSVKSGLSYTVANPTAVLSGTTLPVQFSGLTPGFVGLYQINLMIPAATPPGLLLPLSIQAGTVFSNSVVVAVQ
jgi:uncharacterized protein (TIGR03437 family)